MCQARRSSESEGHEDLQCFSKSDLLLNGKMLGVLWRDLLKGDLLVLVKRRTYESADGPICQSTILHLRPAPRSPLPLSP